MNNYNDIGISRTLDWPRIQKLLTVGVFASVLHLIGDLILGWGVEDETLSGMLRMVSAYTSTSDGGLFAAALLGLFGIVLEGLSYFGIYRLMTEHAPKHAHAYRAGIFGYLMFCACGFHVPICALAFLMKHGLVEELLLQYLKYFIMPAFILFWVFFVVLVVAQLRAFLQGCTPYPKWCWVFSLPVGMVISMAFQFIGNHPFANAISCAWIAIGNLWMFGGLLVTMKIAKRQQ